MNPIVQLYWIRVVLAIVAAAISTVVAVVSGALTNAAIEASINTLLNCIIVALVVYLGSYYVLRVHFRKTIEKQSKIMTTAIAMYFFTWLAFFVLFYTIAKTIIF